MTCGGLTKAIQLVVFAFQVGAFLFLKEVGNGGIFILENILLHYVNISHKELSDRCEGRP